MKPLFPETRHNAALAAAIIGGGVIGWFAEPLWWM